MEGEKDSNPKGSQKSRPIPAPRKAGLRLINDHEKLSSDTDRDITEIDLDEAKLTVKQNRDKALQKSGTTLDTDLEQFSRVPKPKPRKINKKEKISVETKSKEQANEGKKSPSAECQELPLILSIKNNFSQAEDTQKTKEEAKIKNFDTKAKSIISRNTSVVHVPFPLNHFKREKQEPVSLHTKMYVQNKNGFQFVEGGRILGENKPDSQIPENRRQMNASTVEAAVLFQKYWSRTMEFFQGVLAGCAVSHVAVVTAAMLRFDHDPLKFSDLYSSLSLKLHFAFYFMTTLSVVSCLDRIDVGHVNKKHWQIISKVSSTWFILLLYLVSFALTFLNHKQETKFDSFFLKNSTHAATEKHPQPTDQQKTDLFMWYQVVWARDILVLIAWFCISLSKFKDFLKNHLSNMTKYAQHKSEECFQEFPRNHSSMK